MVLGKTLDTDEVIVLPNSCKTVNRNVMVQGHQGQENQQVISYQMR